MKISPSDDILILAGKSLLVQSLGVALKGTDIKSLPVITTFKLFFLTLLYYKCLASMSLPPLSLSRNPTLHHSPCYPNP